jgi:8-oxo-dGTP pyrophosphatase MutT (NUDIX family)
MTSDCWTWELPGGYVDRDEDPALTAAREVEEETGWRPRSMRPLTRFQPLVGTADFENAGRDAAGRSRRHHVTLTVALLQRHPYSESR